MIDCTEGMQNNKNNLITTALTIKKTAIRCYGRLPFSFLILSLHLLLFSNIPWLFLSCTAGPRNTPPHAWQTLRLCRRRCLRNTLPTHATMNSKLSMEDQVISIQLQLQKREEVLKKGQYILVWVCWKAVVIEQTMKKK